jgi:lactoylglutathione lyase
MIKLVSHVGVCVDDIEASTRFYRDVLGFTVRSTGSLAPDVGPIMELDGVRGRNCFLDRGELTIELLEFTTPPVADGLERRPMNRHGFTHMACHVDSIDDVIRPIEDAGGAVLAHTRRQITRGGFDGPIEIMYVTDPNGVRIELIQFPTAAPAAAGDEAREAIVEVLRLYGTLLDQGRFDEWLDLFTSDAVCSVRSSTFEGIDEIGRWIRQKSAFGQHAMATPVVHLRRNDSLATAVVPFAHVMAGTGGAGHLERGGRYFTRLRTIAGRWRIVEHVIAFDVDD